MTHALDRRTLLKAGAAAAVLPVAAGSARAADAPRTVRIGVAQAATGSPPSVAGSSIAIAHAKGWLDEAFAKDGTKVEWNFFKGAGPAVNEALSNRQLDVAYQGDLPGIIGRAAGLKTRVVAATGVRTNIYLAVPPDSPIRRVEDLRGKRVAIFRGTNAQLPILRLLEAHGLAERDIRALNLDTATSLAALATRDIDAAFGGVDLLRLRDRNAARVVYSSKGDSPVFTRQSHVSVTEEFAARHPQAVQRVVDTLVRTARWSSDEANREEVLALWARAGTPIAHWREDCAGESLKSRLNPGFDPFFIARYKDAVGEAVRLKLTRARFDVDAWVDPGYLRQALATQGLAAYWPAASADGKAA